jgi:putative transposase
MAVCSYLNWAGSGIAIAGTSWVRLKNITLSSSGGQWYASIQTERDVQPVVPQSSSAIGIDVGIARFATFSDGSHIEPLNSFKKHEQRLRRYQRAMGRKRKFSQNWHKAKRRVQKIHARIGNVRRDFLHKATTATAKNHAMVCIEDLQVRNMSQSAKGNAAKPGRSVAAKSGLNKAILDQGWGEFRRQLDYKLAWNGGQLIAVAPQHTSQTCPACAHVSAHNRTSQSHFQCVVCNYTNHADVVGAINILARGHRVLACGEEGAGLARKRKTKPPSMKQEPTEETQAIAA